MKYLPFDLDKIKKITAKYPTPFYIYDESGITKTCKDLYEKFNWSKGFKNYFAVKALPNPEILKLINDNQMGVDCSSMAELVLAERTGFSGKDIMFTSNDTPAEEFIKANQLGAIINLDDISHIEFLEKTLNGLPNTLCFRYNPGSERTGNVLIGNPAEAKYGLTREQIFEAYKIAKEKGVSEFGLHTMIASNELDIGYFIETARMMFELGLEIKQKLDIDLSFINLGGGIGIPYLPEQENIDIEKLSSEVQQIYNEILIENNLKPKLFFELGRYVTGPHGYLISSVIHKKNTYREYVGLDASMANLMRPGMYGAYHYITVLGKEDQPHNHTYDVTGSLCENNDKFAIARDLPAIDIGDIVTIHDAGAHGHSMGFNYNGMLRSAELLLKESGEVQLIRRAETLDDYFATLNT